VFRNVLICLLFFLFNFQLNSEDVLGLYKSGEGTTESENEMIWHLKMPLQMLGYRLKLHDVSKGLPEDNVTNKYKVIISWYRSSEMKQAEAYISWLSKQLKNKRKVLVFGNFGFFKDSTTGKWIQNHVLNLFFEELGYKFMGNWTNKSKNLKINKLHPLLNVDHNFEPFRKLNDYLQYKSISKNNLDLAVIERTDIKDGESVVIGITSKGSIALHPYISFYSKQKKSNEYAFEIKRFLKLSMEFKLNDSRKVMCLYKSNDGQDKKENEINWHLKSSLKAAKYHLDFHDISSGLPSDADSDVKAVVSWFRTPAMKNPKKYIRYIERMVNRGIKVIVLGTMGAHQDRASEKWLEGNEINKVFNALGVTFKGNWTNDNQLIDFFDEDTEYFKSSIKEDLNKISHYINIQPNHRSVKSVLVINRKDLKAGKSSVIFISPLGAFAESSFIFGEKSKPYLDIKKFVLASIDGAVVK